MAAYKKARFILSTLLFLLIVTGLFLGWYFNLFPKKSYTAEDFSIATLRSNLDGDGDGTDDYADICQGAREYVNKTGKYKSAYYQGGYPPEGVGVCTDVIWYALQNAGYNLKEMVDMDIQEHQKNYTTIDKPDPNIDFRRVRNLKVFFDTHTEKLTLEPDDIAQWQPGDIIIYGNSHIAVASDKRNKKGQVYIIHHGGQPVQEEDALTRHEIVGHYRWHGGDTAQSSL